MRFRNFTTAVLTVAAVLIAGLLAAPTAGAQGVGRQSAGRQSANAVSTPGSFTALTPYRVLDTRNGTGATKAPVAAHGTVNLTVTDGGTGRVPASGVSAVAINVTATGSSSHGNITVYPTGTSEPTASNLNYPAGKSIPNLVIAKLGAGGRISLTNNSSGTTNLVGDITGYYASGTVSAPGAFMPLNPARLLDTRNGTGAPQAAVAADATVALQVTGNGGVPASGVSAVAINVTVTGPSTHGNVAVYPAGTAEPTTSNLNYVGGQTIPNLVIATLGTGGRIELTNNSTGSTDLVADVTGYFVAGAPLAAGAFGALSPARLLDTRTGTGAAKAKVAAHGTVTLTVTGHGNVPVSDVSAVAVNVTVTGPTAGGNVTVYPAGVTEPTASNLNFQAGQTIPNLVIAKVGTSGQIKLTNNSAGTTNLVADVTGYHLTAALPLPPTSLSYYLRSLNGDPGHDNPIMANAADAASGAIPSTDTRPRLVVLDFGAQTITEESAGGVALTGTNPVVRLTYPEVVNDVLAFINEWSEHATSTARVTIAVATNSDGDFVGYAPINRADAWSDSVIAAIRSNTPSQFTVVGAIDIEAGFGATEAQAAGWVTEYTTKQGRLIEIGSADGCPSTLGTTKTTCGAVPVDGGPTTHTWTQAQYYSLAHTLSPINIEVLPQIYQPGQAAQWANIDRTGATTTANHIAFVGSLTESAADATLHTSTSQVPSQGWAQLMQALSGNSVTNVAALTYASDLDVL